MGDIVLNNGVKIPSLGFGTAAIGEWQQDDDAVVSVIQSAIESGYRYIDGSAVSGNEISIGRAIKKSKINRDELFVVTKVWNGDQGYDATLRAFEQSRLNLGLDVIDLYLIHWPIEDKLTETWKAMEMLYEQKRVRAIGVSNFRINDLEQLLAISTVTPVCNQIELHPYFSQSKLRKYCLAHSIQVIGWSPLGTGTWSNITFEKKPINDSVIQKIAHDHHVSAAQVILRWNVQNNVIPVPKAETEQHIKQNICLDKKKLISFANKHGMYIATI